MMNLPQNVKYIMQRIEFAGGEAYLVGGCVRDMLLGRPIHDWDICTSLLPGQVIDLFPKTVPTGLKHGTVTVIHEGCSCEVTTYRTDGAYLDHRKPDSVTFASSLCDDLSRRDFTVNAMAMDLRGELTDLFDGRGDLHRRILRCVGDPQKRFEEDALRILRCVRFSAQLGFEIEPSTMAAMNVCRGYCASLSAERVRDEVEKVLCSDRPEYLRRLCELGILTRFGIESTAALSELKRARKNRELRWAMLFCLYPSADLKKLRLENSLIRLCCGVFACMDSMTDRVSIKRAVSQHGREAALIAAELFDIPEAVEVIHSGECIEMREMAVCGSDFPDLKGPSLGKLLHELLEYVWANPEKNRVDILKSYAQKLQMPESEHSDK